MDRVRDEIASFEDLAAVTEERTEQMLRLAERALTEAEGAAAGSRVNALRVWEARMHEQSAAVLKRSAALYRRRAEELKVGAGLPRIAGGASAPHRSYTADVERIAAERERIAAERQRIAVAREQLASERAQIVAGLKPVLHQGEQLANEPPVSPPRPPPRKQAE